MSKGNNPDIAWLADVADNNYPAAESYLRLLFSEADALSRINQLRTVKIVRKRPAVPPVAFWQLVAGSCLPLESNSTRWNGRWTP